MGSSVLGLSFVFDAQKLLGKGTFVYLSRYINVWLLFVLFLAVFFLIGWLIEKIILPRIKRKNFQPSWISKDHLYHILRSKITLFSFLLGGFLADLLLPFDESSKKLVLQIIGVGAILFTSYLISTFTLVFLGIYLSQVDPVGERVPNSSIIKNIIKLVVFSLGFLMIFNFLGVSITPILTALGVGGLAVALALQDTLGNLFAGLQIVATGRIKPGDYIILTSGQTGYVQDITWRYTTLKTLFNTMVIVPNSTLGQQIVTNYVQENNEIIFMVRCGVSYSSDLDYVQKVTEEVAKNCQLTVAGANKEYVPFIRYDLFAESNIEFSVRLCVDEFKDKFLLEHEFIKSLHRRFAEEKIEISYPIRILQNRG